MLSGKRNPLATGVAFPAVVATGVESAAVVATAKDSVASKPIKHELSPHVCLVVLYPRVSQMCFFRFVLL
jgi:hypothetical protein